MLRTRRLGTQLMRSPMLFTSNAASFLAIVYIPLGKAAAITMMAPLLVLPLAWIGAGRAGGAAAYRGAGDRLRGRADPDPAGQRGLPVGGACSRC